MALLTDIQSKPTSNSLNDTTESVNRVVEGFEIIFVSAIVEWLAGEV